MKFKRHKLFYKYLISYILIMMIPILILNVFINHSLFSRLENQYVKNNKETLNQFVYTTDRDISQLEVIRNHIISDANLRVLTDISDVQASKEVIKELKKHSVSNNYILDIVLYIEDDPYIYTSASSYTRDNFFSGKQFYQDWSTEDFLQTLEKPFSVHIRPQERINLSGKNYEAISFMYPISLKNKKAYLIFLVDAKNLSAEEASSTFFMANNNELIYSSDSIQVPDKIYKEFEKLNELEGAEGHIEFISDNEYLMNFKNSGDTNLSYYKVTAIEDVYADYYNLKKWFRLIILAILVLGGFLIYFSININYHPLKRLKNMADGFIDWPNKGQEESRDLIKSIENTMTNLADENTKLKSTRAKVEIEEFLEALLKGKVVNLAEFREKTNKLQLNALKGPYYFVIILSFKVNKDQERIQTEKLENLINEILPGYLQETENREKFVFLGGLDKDNETEFKYKILALHNLLKDKYPMDVAIGTGSINKGFIKIPKSYMDASLAIDYCFIKGNDCVIDSSQLILNEDIGAFYPQRKMDKLNYAIRNEGVEEINKVVGEISEYIKTSELPLYYVKGVCYQLINNISSIIDEMNEDILTDKNKFSYATVLADFETVDELLEAIKNISINISSFIREKKTDTESELIGKIKEYIEKHAMDSNFSVQNTADYFDMNPPAISSFFKYNTGSTIIEYVTDLRMNHTKKLLLKGKYTIKEIVPMVGYINVSSFIRKFKSIYGLTPGQYVKHNKEKGAK